MTAKTNIPVAVLDEAKRMFMEYVPLSVIATQLGVARTSLSYHATTYWNLERELAKSEMFAAFASQKKVTMTRLSEAALKILVRAMENSADSDNAPTLKEGQQTAMILESIDKILRLDEGTPTDITESRPTTTIELKRRLLLDPFAEIQDVEVKELE
jgi:hypothetical protein